jgi:hypothetical protein
MIEQVLVTDDYATGIGRPNLQEKENGLTAAFSLLATARPLCAVAAKSPGHGNEVGPCRSSGKDAMQAVREIAVPPAGAVALLRTRLRGDSNDVVKRIDVEILYSKERPQLDETSAAIAAFLSCKM